MGLELDASEHSRIYELTPDYADYLDNSAQPGLLYRAMNRFAAADRRPGPAQLFEVSLSARRRWCADAKDLRDGTPYRPPTLASVNAALNALGPLPPSAPEGRFEMYQVQRGDTLGALAKRYYGNPMEWNRIFSANCNKLEHPDRIYVGQLLRIPLD
jgi:hypothetical protein